MHGPINLHGLVTSMAPKRINYIEVGSIHGPKACKFVCFVDVHGRTNFKGFGGISGPKACKFMRLGDTHGTNTCKFIWFGDIHGANVCVW